MAPETVEDTYARYLHQELPFLAIGQCYQLVEALKPEVAELGMKDGSTFFAVTMSRAANALGAMMSGDKNAAHHTDGGIMQTLALVGMCAAVTSTFRAGFQLLKITPDVSFKGQVPTGVPVITGIKTIRGRGSRQTLELDAWVDDVSIFRAPRELLLYKI